MSTKPIDHRDVLRIGSWLLFAAAIVIPIVGWLAVPKALPPYSERAEAAQKIFAFAYTEAAIVLVALGVSIAAWRVKMCWPMWRSIVAAVLGGIATYFLLTLAIVRSLNFG